MLRETDALMILAHRVLLMAFDALQRFSIGADHWIGKVFLVIEPKSVWIGHLERDRAELRMIFAEAGDDCAPAGRSASSAGSASGDSE